MAETACCSELTQLFIRGHCMLNGDKLIVRWTKMPPSLTGQRRGASPLPVKVLLKPFLCTASQWQVITKSAGKHYYFLDKTLWNGSFIITEKWMKYPVQVLH